MWVDRQRRTRRSNAVERVHFVEYGLVAFLFYRVLARQAGDASIVVLPLLASFTVGTFDEWLQWFIPVRVGEAHDVFLNLAAIVCGLLFALALQPPPVILADGRDPIRGAASASSPPSSG